MTGRFFTKFLALSIAMASVLVAVSPMATEAQARDASDWVIVIWNAQRRTCLVLVETTHLMRHQS